MDKRVPDFLKALESIQSAQQYHVKVLGEIVLYASSTEHQVDWAIWSLLAANTESELHRGHAVTAPLRTKSKLKLLKALGDAHMKKEEQKKLADIVGTIRACTRKRDLLVHYDYDYIFDAKDNLIGLEIKKVTADEKIKMSTEKLMFQDLEKVPKQIDMACEELIDLINEYDRRHRFPSASP